MPYPLIDEQNDWLQAASGRSIHEIELENLDTLTPEDLRIRAETLKAQAETARQHGFGQLAANLERAAELTRVPNDILLKIYESLRPRRSTYDELIKIAALLDTTYAAPITAAFVREAADVYRTRHLLRE